MTAQEIFQASQSAVFQVFGRSQGGVGGQRSGTGFIHDLDLAIGITNAHVVDGVVALKARLSDGSVYSLHTVATDPCRDLAVVHFSDPLPTDVVRLPLGDSDAVQSGQTVIALGYPGTVTQSVTSAPPQVTQGIVAAAPVTFDVDPTLPVLTETIQHTAPIGPGSSGGPLLDDQGNVIGINTLASTDTGAIAEQYFALGINRAHSEAEVLMTGKSQNHLGMTLYPRTVAPLREVNRIAGWSTPDQVREVEKTLPGGGLWVTGLEAGARPEIAGIETLDLVTAIDEVSVANMGEVCDIFQSVMPGEMMSVDLVRFGSGLTSEEKRVRFRAPGAHVVGGGSGDKKQEMQHDQP